MAQNVIYHQNEGHLMKWQSGWNLGKTRNKEEKPIWPRRVDREKSGGEKWEFRIFAWRKRLGLERFTLSLTSPSFFPLPPHIIFSLSFRIQPVFSPIFSSFPTFLWEIHRNQKKKLNKIKKNIFEISSFFLVHLLRKFHASKCELKTSGDRSIASERWRKNRDAKHRKDTGYVRTTADSSEALQP